MTFVKINDLSNSKFRKRFLDEEFVPESSKAVCMGRVSIQKNKDKGNSDVAQLEAIETYAKQESLEVLRSWDVAETASKHHKRKHFKEMIAYVKVSNIKHIIFSHQSRSNRNDESAREIEFLVRNHGVTLHCVRDKLKLTDKSSFDDWMRWSIFNLLNKKFIDDHTKNVAGGIVKRIENGLYSGKAPFGYKNYRPAEDALSYFVFDPVAKPVMETAFEIFGTGDYSVSALERELKTRFPGVKIPGYKRLWELLVNPFYYGDFIYDGELHKGNPDYHPPMIPFSLWKKVQDIFDRPNRSKQKCTSRDHPYIGLIKCGGQILDSEGYLTDEICGCSVTAEAIKKTLANGNVIFYNYWRCSNSTRKCSQRNREYLWGIGKKTVSYSEPALESLMGKMFEPLHFSDEVCNWMQATLKEQHKQKSADDRQRRSAVQSRYEMVSRHIERAYQDKLDGSISDELWRGHNRRWMEEQDQLTHQLNDMKEDNAEYLETGVLLIELAQRTETIFKSATPAIKRKLVEIVSSNRILKDGRLEYDYRKPFDMLAKVETKENWWTAAATYRTFCQQNMLPKPSEIRRLLAA